MRTIAQTMRAKLDEIAENAMDAFLLLALFALVSDWGRRPPGT